MNGRSVETAKRILASRAGERLRSERGASLPLVLFLFLICAMASAIVLAAATASTGRFAQLAESDQLYYSATSAAGFIKDYIETSDEAVTVITRSATVPEGGTGTTYSGTMNSRPLLGIDGSSSSGLSPSYLEQAALLAVFGSYAPTQVIIGADWNSGIWYDDFPKIAADTGTGTGFEPISMKLEYTPDLVNGGPDYLDDLLEANVTASMKDGNLIYTVTKSSGDNETILIATCAPGFETSSNVVRNTDGSTTTTETVRVTWSVTEVAKNETRDS